MITEEFQLIATKVKEFLENESSGHDFYHAERVFNNAIYLQNYEKGDSFVIGCAALLHDICRSWEKKTGKSHFGDEALDIIKDILVQTNTPNEKIVPILEVIKYHDIYDWSEKVVDKSIELQIIQDADNLDAIGAIGIARTFTFGGAHNCQMYSPGENLEFNHDFVENPQVTTSTIAHFYEKLLKLKDHMNTKTAKQIAQKRHQFMEDFLQQFFDEWNGKFN